MPPSPTVIWPHSHYFPSIAPRPLLQLNGLLGFLGHVVTLPPQGICSCYFLSGKGFAERQAWLALSLLSAFDFKSHFLRETFPKVMGCQWLLAVIITPAALVSTVAPTLSCQICYPHHSCLNDSSSSVLFTTVFLAPRNMPDNSWHSENTG